jgi:hypothetical protein
MELSALILLLTRLGVGAIATFLAILLWSQTRDVSWVLVIIGTLVGYAGTVLTTLESFGIVSTRFFLISGFPALRLAMENLPLIFLSLGFIAAMSRKRLP